jgi:hypothetical protein
MTYREGMHDPDERFTEELDGLDPNDPEAMAFAEHLRRMHQTAPTYTIEGQLTGFRRFAESANRAEGHRRLMAVLLVSLILLGVAFAVLRAAVEVFSTFVGG